MGLLGDSAAQFTTKPSTDIAKAMSARQNTTGQNPLSNVADAASTTSPAPTTTAVPAPATAAPASTPPVATPPANNPANGWLTEAPGSTGVADRLTDLTSGNSGLIRQARASGLRLANKRGVLNSSMAVDASEDAANRAALPIAQQDASTATSFVTQARGILGQSNLSAQEATQQGGLANQSFENQRSLQAQAAQTQTQLAQFNAEQAKVLAGMQERNQLLIQTTDAGAKIFSDLDSQISAILQNASLDLPSKTAAANVLLHYYQGSLELQSSLLNYGGVPNTPAQVGTLAQTGNTIQASNAPAAGGTAATTSNGFGTAPSLNSLDTRVGATPPQMVGNEWHTTVPANAGTGSTIYRAMFPPGEYAFRNGQWTKIG